MPLDPDLQLLLDKQELYEVLVRYTRGLDRQDRKLLLGCFHPGATFKFHLFDGTIEEFFERVWPGSIGNDGGKRDINVQHAVTNYLFEIEGDVANGESYLEGRRAGVGGLRRGADSPSTEVGFPTEFVGRYLDRFERRDGQWRIAHREMTVEWVPNATYLDALPKSPPK